jgi:hypothetical protein
VQSATKARGLWTDSAINNRPGVVLNSEEKNSFEFVDSLDLQLGDDYSIVVLGICQTGILLSKGDSTGEPPTRGFAILNSASRLHFGKNADFSANESDKEKSRLRTRILIAHQDHLEWFVDGQLAGTSTIAHNIGEAKPLLLGTREKSPRYAEAIVCEFMLYNRDLDAEERQAVEQYLAAQWFH